MMSDLVLILLRGAAVVVLSLAVLQAGGLLHPDVAAPPRDGWSMAGLAEAPAAPRADASVAVRVR